MGFTILIEHYGKSAASFRQPPEKRLESNFYPEIKDVLTSIFVKL